MTAPAEANLNGTISAVRRFNRFYTRQIGLLEEGILKSRFTLTEARVLYELANREGLTAKALGRELRLNSAYLTRILTKFEAEGLLVSTPAKPGKRRAILSLTAAGRRNFAFLDEASQRQVTILLKPLSGKQRAKLARATDTIEQLLGGDQQGNIPQLIPTAQSGGLPIALLRLADLFRIWCRRSRTRRQLARLDDRLLRDIGISRKGAEDEVRKWFWQQ